MLSVRSTQVLLSSPPIWPSPTMLATYAKPFTTTRPSIARSTRLLSTAPYLASTGRRSTLVRIGAPPGPPGGGAGTPGGGTFPPGGGAPRAPGGGNPGGALRPEPPCVQPVSSSLSYTECCKHDITGLIALFCCLLAEQTCNHTRTTACICKYTFCFRACT